jgi:hypothetical protein
LMPEARSRRTDPSNSNSRGSKLVATGKFSSDLTSLLATAGAEEARRSLIPASPSP